MRLTEGGAITELVRVAWQGPPNGAGIAAVAAAIAPSVLALVGLTSVLVVAARRTFRWNPRH